MDDSDSKTCSKCGKVKSRTAFGARAASRDGLFARCRSCRASERLRLRAMSPEERQAETLRRASERTCTCCGETKPIENFYTSGRYHDSKCKVCARAQVRAAAAAKRASDPDAFRVAQREWKSRNPDRVIANRRRYLEAHPEYLAIQSERAREWAAANPEKAAASRVRRRARRWARLKIKMEELDLEALWTGSCSICGEPIDPDLKWPDRMSKSIDHVLPLSKGGHHVQDNVAWSHLVCNMRKSAKTT